MSNVLYELAQYQACQDKVRTEINKVLENSGGEITYENIKQMTYLEQIMSGSFTFYRMFFHGLYRLASSDSLFRDFCQFFA